jgi:hypothetical protein
MKLQQLLSALVEVIQVVMQLLRQRSTQIVAVLFDHFNARGYIGFRARSHTLLLSEKPTNLCSLFDFAVEGRCRTRLKPGSVFYSVGMIAGDSENSDGCCAASLNSAERLL